MLQNRCFSIHLKGTRRKLTPPATQEPSTSPRTTNQQQAMIKTQNLAYNRPTAPHPAYHRHSPCPLTNSFDTPPATQYLTTHQTYVPLYPNPPPLHAIPYTTSPSLIPSASSNIRTRTTNTLSYFSRNRHPPQYPGWIPANDHIFLWEVMHNVQQQLNNMMSVMSTTPASWGKPTYTQ